MTSAVRRPRSGGPALPACPSVNPTASRLAAPAPIRTASAAAREASSVRARREVAGASAIVDQTQTRNTSAATSSANNAATDHDAPPATATPAATAPPAAPTITRRAATPGPGPGLTDSAAWAAPSCARDPLPPYRAAPRVAESSLEHVVGEAARASRRRRGHLVAADDRMIPPPAQ